MLGSYEKLLSEAKDLILWEGIKSLAEWDYETQMPQGGMNQRSMQMALIEEAIHEKWIDPQIQRLLSEVRKSPDYEAFSEEDKRNVHLMQRRYDQETELPDELVEAIAKHRIVCDDAWKKAKATGDYSLFRRPLGEMVELVKRQALCWAPEKDPYDTLIDYHEPGVTAATISRVFDSLGSGLALLTKKCVESENKLELSFLKRPVPIEVQRKISQKLMEFAKYDLNRGRIDETEHAFTYGLYDDVRICTHYYEKDFSSSLFAVLHEAGHALYEQNIREVSLSTHWQVLFWGDR